VTVQTDWSIHVPLDTYLRNVSPLTLKQARIASMLPDDQIAQMQNNLVMLESLGLQGARDPYFKDRTHDMEVIH
jgi:hypothetical protein